jgi:hypothetical protein
MSSSSSSTSPLSSLVSPLDSPQGRTISPHSQALISNGTTNNGDSSFSTAFSAQQTEYRQVAFKELLDSEMVHVQELQGFYEGYLALLQKSEM